MGECREMRSSRKKKTCEEEFGGKWCGPPEDEAAEQPGSEESGVLAPGEDAVQKEKDAQSAVTDQKNRIQRAKDTLKGLSPDYLGYANLHEKKLSKTVGEWNYDISFFKSAAQGST